MSKKDKPVDFTGEEKILRPIASTRFNPERAMDESESRRYLMDMALYAEDLGRGNHLNEVVGNIMADFFLEFTQTEPHEAKKREHLYAKTEALRDLRIKFAAYDINLRNFDTVVKQKQQVESNTLQRGQVNEDKFL